MVYDIQNYLKELFTEGKNWLLTLFDILGMVLFLFPHLAQGIVSNNAIVRTIGLAIFLLSFLGANFILYRKSHKKSSISEKSLLLYYLSRDSKGQIHFLGQETVQDLAVRLTYRTQKGEEVRQLVNQFFRFGVPDLHGSDVKVLKENDNFLFPLPIKSETSDGKVLVEISFVGSISGNKIEKKQVVELKDPPPPQSFAI